MSSDGIVDLRHVCFEGRRADTPPERARRRRPARPTPPVERAEPARSHSSAHPRTEVGPADRFARQVLERSGLGADGYRAEPLRRRTAACLRTLNARSIADATAALDERPDLLPRALSALLIGVTDFFRDAPVFDALRDIVLQDLVGRGGPLRVWSAGCANGAELYSVAILFEEAGLLDCSFLLGTDCRADAIASAEAATYDADELRRVGMRVRHFDAVGNAWRPVERLRRHARWKVADLGRETEDGPWDIILWRNTAIYLTASNARRIFERLVAVLVPGGFLVLGKAERPPADLPLVAAGHCVYRKVGGGHGD